MKTLNWTTEKRKVKDLIEFEYNPRFMTDERKQKLLASLEKFNLVEIPAINTDNKLIAGHQRIKALLELGRGEEIIDVRVPSRTLTESEFKEYNITSNLPAGFWDTDLLEQAFADIDLKALGLNVDKIEIPEIKIHKEEVEPDFEPIIPRDPKTVAMDLLEFISVDKKLTHRLLCDSSTTIESYNKLFDDNKKINLTITDPPYNVDYTGGTQEALKIENDKMDSKSFYQFLFDFYSLAFDHSKAGAPIYVFHADSEGANFRTALVDAKFKLSQCLIWLKNSIVMGRQDYHWIHEPILYGWKEGKAHPWYTDRTQKTVVEFDKPLRNDEHPTMKPVGLFRYFIENSSKVYDLVFDGFFGSATTLIACELSRRNARGLELDPRFVDVAVRRWHNYMVENGLDYKILRNGRQLSEEEIQEYYKRV